MCDLRNPQYNQKNMQQTIHQNLGNYNQRLIHETCFG